MLSEATHSATSNAASTDPGFAIDKYVATCAIVPENDGAMWWAAKFESKMFACRVGFISSREYYGNDSEEIR